MDKAEIIEKVNHYLSEEFEVDKELIAPDAGLKDTLQLDSLDYVDLVVILESNFHFKVQASDFQGIVTFRNLYDYIFSKVQSVQD